MHTLVNTVGVRLNCTPSTALQAPETRGQWGLVPIVESKCKEDWAKYRNFKLVAPDTLNKRLMVDRALQFLSRIPEHSSTTTTIEKLVLRGNTVAATQITLENV